MPSSTAAPSISKASASLWPYLPQVSRALPTPPMDPHPRITWDTSMPVPPRGTLCIGRGYAGRQRSRPEPSQRSPPLVTKLHAMVVEAPSARPYAGDRDHRSPQPAQCGLLPWLWPQLPSLLDGAASPDRCHSGVCHGGGGLGSRIIGARAARPLSRLHSIVF